MHILVVAMLCIAHPRYVDERQDKPVAATTWEIVAMANPVWVSITGDWSSTASWSTGLVPVSTDIVTFDGARSQQSVTAGLAQGAVDLAYLIVQPSYTGDIGASSGHLVIAADKMIHRGSGTLYISPTSNNLDMVVCDAPSGALFLNGIMAHVHNLAGQVTIQAASTGTKDIEQWGSQSNTTIKVGAAAPEYIVVRAGTMLSAVAPTTALIVHGGYLEQTAWGAAGADVYIQGGYFKFLPTAVPAQSFSTLTVGAGVADFSEVQFATTVGSLVIGPMGEVMKSDIGTFGSTHEWDFRKTIP